MSSGARVHWVGLIGAGAGTQAYAWRLLGPNNRELGRSTSMHLSIDEAYDHAVGLRSRITHDSIRYSRNPRGDWAWVAAVDGDEHARSCRDFRRERESVYNANAFVEGLQGSDIKLPDPAGRMVVVRAAVFLGEETAVAR